MKMKGLRQSNKGFTLAEICVTMVIISVLASVTTLGLMSWTHDSEFNKQEQNAELIYMAVKNKIAIYKSNNSINEIKGWVDYKASEDINLNAESGSNDSGEVGTTAGYMYLFCNNDEYGKWKNGGKNNPEIFKSRTASYLFDFVASYIYNKTILDAYICIEFDKSGDVLGVYYSDRTKFYEQTEDIDNPSTGISLAELKKNESLRYDKLVGAYRPG